MRVVKLDDISLTSSNVAISTYAEYASGTTYASGNNVRVSLESDGITARYPVEEYTSLSSSNTGNYPPNDLVNWSLIGAENRWKMFDDFTNTDTENTSSIEVVVDASSIDMVGLFNIQAISVDFELTAYSEVKISETIDLLTIPESSWYSYYFNDITFQTDLLWSFTSYASASLKITITYYSGELAKCGMLVVGKQYDLGKSYYEPSIGIIDYSIKEADSLGRVFLNQGNFADKIDIDFWMDNDQVDAVKKTMTSLRGVPAIYDCNNDANKLSLVVYGFYREFTIIIPGPVKSKCSISIEGLI